ncbi:chromate transporter [Paenactinomyces guangxiensis]|uniref:Chromate transporter n=1 Tax=Paenactinomyces guangxiensis TaxID=1490290 RepID=A0A7W2A8K8_9BACL|nr:chromate transporter [Paenactinomyces guangxiensis]MBA4493923.1 chromate transporter [Paenactinomyces guangxiensis]MBH8591390.1 chromate transporter [Paenactinomyces guangxiensis]
MTDEKKKEANPSKEGNSVLEVLGVATRLGLTSFGGPIAHIGYFRDEYVNRRKWLDEKAYADLVALCQFLPGPASSQVGIAIGMIRAGLPGALAAWIGFTFPSALALVIFAYVVQRFQIQEMGWIHGLLVVAVAVVAQAVWGMARNLAPDRPRATIAFLAAIAAVTWQTALGQVLIIVTAGFIGWWLLPKRSVSESSSIRIPMGRKAALISWGLFFALLLLLPLMRQISSGQWLALFDSFYRTGSLVFGGGHVVLPLLQAEVVPTGWMSSDQFLAGYGAAQVVPGPLFTFAAYLGTVISGWPGALLATVAIFLSSFLLIIGALPFWEWIRTQPKFQAALNGINAAVVGILLGALYDPVWTKAIQSPADFSLALIAFGLLTIWKLPPWVVVVFSAMGGAILSLF